MSDTNKSHAIAAIAAKVILADSQNDPDLNLEKIIMTLESTVAIVISFITKMKSSPDNAEAFATEMMHSMTDSAHARVIKALRSDPF